MVILFLMNPVGMSYVYILRFDFRLITWGLQVQILLPQPTQIKQIQLLKASNASPLIECP